MPRSAQLRAIHDVTRSSAFRIWNCRGSSAGTTSSQVSGIDTGAPPTGRTLYGTTSSWPCAFWPQSR
ncbi:MAG: hypothetical protein E6J91_04910 [Deltaproteobacteria bacterium]|nr:MAG: hypothetical protein E6J91_04910 [Deltaproteobacteria bacterium]